MADLLPQEYILVLLTTKRNEVTMCMWCFEGRICTQYHSKEIAEKVKVTHRGPVHLKVTLAPT